MQTDAIVSKGKLETFSIYTLIRPSHNETSHLFSISTLEGQLQMALSSGSFLSLTYRNKRLSDNLVTVNLINLNINIWQRVYFTLWNNIVTVYIDCDDKMMSIVELNIPPKPITGMTVTSLGGAYGPRKLIKPYKVI